MDNRSRSERTSRRQFLGVAGTAAAATSVATAGCLDSITGGTTTLQANSPAAEGSVHGDAAEWIGEIVEEETGGDIEIDPFRNSELGGQIESIENVSSGDLDMYVIPYALTGALYPDAQVFDMPYMYDDDRPFEHIYEATDPVESDAARGVIEDLADDMDIRSLGSVAGGTRVTTLIGDTASNPTELSEFLLRAVPIPVYEQTVVGMGAQTTEIDFEEVPQALATGSIDGQENPYDIIVSSGIHENTDYVIETNHMHTPLAVLVNEDLWQDFDESTQEIFYDAVTEIQPRATETIEDSTEALKDEVRDEGVEIIPPEDLEMDAFRDQTRAHMREEFPDFMDIVEEIHGGEY